MKKVMAVILLLGIILTGSSFATPFGLIFTNTVEPVTAGSTVGSTKSAEGTNFSILSIFAIGDSGAESIAKNSGITKISHIDKHTLTVFVIFAMETFTVYGN